MQDKVLGKDSIPESDHKTTPEMDQINLEGSQESQDPVYKITRLKSDLPSDFDAIKTTEPHVNKRDDLQIVERHDAINGTVKNSESVEESSEDIHGGEWFVDKVISKDTRDKITPAEDIADLQNVTNKIHNPGEVDQTIEDTSLSVDNMMPEAPVKMTYILPKEIPIFKMGKQTISISYFN